MNHFGAGAIRPGKERVSARLDSKRQKKRAEDDKVLRTRLNTLKALTEAKRQALSANHNLKIVLEKLSNASSQKAGLLDDDLEAVVANTLVFLRNAHNGISRMAVDCGYDLRYRGPSADQVERRRAEVQLDRLIASQKRGNAK